MDMTMKARSLDGSPITVEPILLSFDPFYTGTIWDARSGNPLYLTVKARGSHWSLDDIDPDQDPDFLLTDLGEHFNIEPDETKEGWERNMNRALRRILSHLHLPILHLAGPGPSEFHGTRFNDALACSYRLGH